jgi:L-aspartate oxidase
LASNSLLEGLVFGARAGKAALQARSELSRGVPATAVDLSPSDWMLDPQVRFRVQDLMWQKVGLVRERNGLEQAVDELGDIVERAPNRRTRNFATLAALMAQAALWRQESRGAHFRSDFPERDDIKWRCHSVQALGNKIRGVSNLSS